MNAVDASLHRQQPVGDIRHDWTRADIRALFDLPFPELIFRAQTIHRAHFDPSKVQMSTLMSIKTGGCPEDCAYCPQSAHHDTGLKASKLVNVDEVMQAAQAAKESGSTRFCMGAAWRSPKDRDMDDLCEIVEGVKAMGMETCMTLGMLDEGQAAQLAEAGADRLVVGSAVLQAENPLQAIRELEALAVQRDELPPVPDALVERAHMGAEFVHRFAQRVARRQGQGRAEGK